MVINSNKWTEPHCNSLVYNVVLSLLESGDKYWCAATWHRPCAFCSKVVPWAVLIMSEIAAGSALTFSGEAVSGWQWTAAVAPGSSQVLMSGDQALRYVRLTSSLDTHEAYFNSTCSWHFELLGDNLSASAPQSITSRSQLKLHYQKRLPSDSPRSVNPPSQKKSKLKPVFVSQHREEESFDRIEPQIPQWENSWLKVASCENTTSLSHSLEIGWKHISLVLSVRKENEVCLWPQPKYTCPLFHILLSALWRFQMKKSHLL